MALSACSVAQTKPFSIPEVLDWTPSPGQFTTTEGIDDKRIKFSAEKTENAGNSLDESYTIVITPGNITATAHSPQGLRYARTTLCQMFETSENGSLPCGTINDHPEYRLRGFMLDCGRKFIPMSYLHQLVDVMAYYKMNTLHLHLNDNGFRQYFENSWDKTYAAFRLECDTYPGLTSTDGFYTKKEYIDLVKHGERVGVEIIPEIDVPAHVLALTHYDPSLGSEEFGMDHLNLRRPDKVYPFVDALFKEYLEGDNPVFCGPHVNIGTDEYSNRDSAVVEEFRRFTDHYIRLVESYGKQAVLWGSLTHAKGTTPVKVDNVLMNCWSNGYADPQEMKRLGYQLVSIPDGYVYIVPAAGYYYDYLNCQMLYEHWTPANIGGVVLPENDPQIEGGMFAVWNDHCGNGISTDDIHHRIFPALQTIAAKTWTASRTTFDYTLFSSLRNKLSEAPGVNRLGRQDFGPTDRIGFDNIVTFDIDYRQEPLGAVAFYNADTKFYLTDPVSGRVGFSYDGYLFTFDYILRPGRHTISVESTNTSTRLYVDGLMVSSLDRHWLWFQPEGKARMATVPTLMFPTTPAKCKSKIGKLTVKPKQDPD